MVSSGCTGKYGLCKVMRSPIFHPYFLLSSTSTIAPVRSRCQARTWSGGTILSDATFRYSSGSVATWAKAAKAPEALEPQEPAGPEAVKEAVAAAAATTAGAGGGRSR